MALNTGAINVGPAGYRLVAWGSVKNADATVSGGNGISAGTHMGTGNNTFGIAAGLVESAEKSIVITRFHGATGVGVTAASASATSGTVSCLVNGAASDAGYVHVEIWVRNS